VTPEAGPEPGSEAVPEAALVGRVLDTLLREDVGGLRSRAVPVVRADGTWLAVDDLLLPVRPGGFLADHVVRRPLVVRQAPDGPLPVHGLAGVLAACAPRDDPEAEEGYAAFAAECRQAAEVGLLHAAARSAVLARLGAGPPPLGVAGLGYYETLAGFQGHPVYPTSQARVGVATDDLPRYAPELAPAFPLRWAALPAAAVRRTGELPPYWPTAAQVGLVGRPVRAGGPAETVLLPVHPLTASAGLLPATATLAPGAYLDVTPTLSMRTVAVLADPGTHLKLPLAMCTLGRRNRRSLVPGTLPDGAATHRVLAEVLAREPAYVDQILLADETTYAETGDEHLAYLVRRLPAGLDRARVVPVAALLATTPAGRCVFEELAAELFGGDPRALLAGYLDLLLGWHSLLWLRYGVALEAHQQNVALVLDRQPGGADGGTSGGIGSRIRLLYKDNDGPRLDRTRLAAALGPAAPAEEDLADQRSWDATQLPAVFTTITLHLCAAALAYGLAECGLLPLDETLSMIRRRLGRAAADAGPDGGPLRELLAAERLPVKSMVTAGTLLPKSRTGARDINKHYGSTCPNYLLEAP